MDIYVFFACCRLCISLGSTISWRVHVKHWHRMDLEARYRSVQQRETEAEKKEGRITAAKRKDEEKERLHQEEEERIRKGGYARKPRRRRNRMRRDVWIERNALRKRLNGDRGRNVEGFG